MTATTQPSPEAIQQRLAYAVLAMWVSLPIMIGMDTPDPAVFQSLATLGAEQAVGGALVFTMLRKLGKGMALLVVSILMLLATSLTGVRFLS
jgi:hypothetical protein